MNLYYLAHLVQLKNDLNRKRRRFYALAHPGTTSIKLRDDDPKAIKYKAEYKKNYPDFNHDFPVHHVYPKLMHPAYSLMEAQAGYTKAQRDMKAMTPHMRKVRTELGARFRWSDHGAISEIVYENCVYNEAAIAKLANDYRADKIILEDARGPYDIRLEEV